MSTLLQIHKAINRDRCVNRDGTPTGLSPRPLRVAGFRHNEHKVDLFTTGMNRADLRKHRKRLMSEAAMDAAKARC